MNRLIMQMLMNVLLHQLGSGSSNSGANPYAAPFGANTGKENADEPIEVDAQVFDEAAAKAKAAWKANTAPSSSTRALDGSTQAPSVAPLVYEVLAALVVLLVLALPLHINPLLAIELGLLTMCALNDVRLRKVPVACVAIAIVLAVALRIQALLAGGIASLIIIPGVAGLIFAAVIGLVFFGLNVKFGPERTLMGIDDIALLFAFGALAGYPFVIDFACAWVITFGVCKLAHKENLPLSPAWVVAGFVHFFAFGFLGLS